MTTAPVTEQELRQAYDRSDLKARGVSFRQALDNVATLRVLEASANAARILPQRRHVHHTTKRDQEAKRHGQARLFD